MAIKLDGAHLANGHVAGDFRPPCSLGYPPAVSTRDFEVMAVQVNGVVGHGEIAKADAHPVPLSVRRGGLCPGRLGCSSSKD